MYMETDRGAAVDQGPLDRAPIVGQQQIRLLIFQDAPEQERIQRGNSTGTANRVMTIASNCSGTPSLTKSLKR